MEAKEEVIVSAAAPLPKNENADGSNGLVGIFKQIAGMSSVAIMCSILVVVILMVRSMHEEAVHTLLVIHEKATAAHKEDRENDRRDRDKERERDRADREREMNAMTDAFRRMNDAVKENSTSVNTVAQEIRTLREALRKNSPP